MSFFKYRIAPNHIIIACFVVFMAIILAMSEHDQPQPMTQCHRQHVYSGSNMELFINDRAQLCDDYCDTNR